MLIVVTGGGGKIGRRVIADLREHGHRIRSVDFGWIDDEDHRRADLRVFWQALDALDGADAVVHLAGVGAPETLTRYRALAEQETFASNTISTYNVFQAAASLGIHRVVWASSETVLGFPFKLRPPDFLPLDEKHPLRPEYSYALSKAIGEQLAIYSSLREEGSIIALRFSVVLGPANYAKVLPKLWNNPTLAKWNYWSYVDIRDVATSCRVALEVPLKGAEAFIIAAPDTLMDRPTEQLLREHFPSAIVNGPLARFQSLLSTEKAERLLGFRPRRSWRDEVPLPASNSSSHPG